MGIEMPIQTSACVQMLVVAGYDQRQSEEQLNRSCPATKVFNCPGIDAPDYGKDPNPSEAAMAVAQHCVVAVEGNGNGVRKPVPRASRNLKRKRPNRGCVHL